MPGRDNPRGIAGSVKSSLTMIVKDALIVRLDSKALRKPTPEV